MVAPSWGPGTGSPPRMRGKVLAALMPTNALGITPAYAGKSSGPLHVNCLGRDHPRVCGEKCLVPVGRRCAGGSPPRMRGKEIAPLSVWLYLGITPAYAGKRGHGRQSGRSAGDHPRVCGEKVLVRLFGPFRGGSPPRMRGKVCERLAPLGQWGITPAYAGKRAVCCRWPARPGDHPRVCGEKYWRL